MSDLSCPSCTHSEQIERRGGLWCLHLSKPARSRCGDFEYEPGTDANEVSAASGGAKPRDYARTTEDDDGR